jgi:hypothetical protein
MPSLFWGDLYIVGGDDSRLYYIFPFEYLRNFAFNVIGGNTLGGNMGYFPVSYPAPILLVLTVLKHVFPMWNTQLLAYGIILSFGFLFFYKFLLEWVPAKNTYTFASGIVASLLYIWSPYVTRTFYQHQLISIFSVIAVPGFLYLFVAGVKRKNIGYVMASSLLYSLLSSTVYSLPWMLPVVFTLIPLFVYFARQHRDYVWKALAIFVVVTVLSNMYWIIHYVVPLLYQTGESLTSKTFLSQEFIKQNNDTIAALTRLNAPVYQIISFLRTSWSSREGPTLLQSIGVVYIFFILLAGTVIRKVAKSFRRLFIVAVIGLLVAMLFVTPSFGEWNLLLFQLLNRYVPFFGMFRNMYDKFSLAMAFNYAFTLYVALVLLGNVRFPRVFRFVSIAAIAIVLSVTSLPYVSPRYNDSVYSTRISGELNKDFWDMVAYLREHPTSSRYLWLPMTYPGYIYMSDSAGENHFYSGISPLQFLSRSSDLAGYYGIQTPLNPDLNGVFFDLLKLGEFDAAARILKSQNIGYVIVNHEVLPAEARVFLDAYDFMTFQGEQYRDTILGEKIRDFGSRYSLYTLNKKYALPTVFATLDITRPQQQATLVTFEKLSDNAYSVGLKEASGASQLVLLEPYSGLWSIYLARGDKRIRYETIHEAVYNFGNAWHVDPAHIASRFPDMVHESSDGAYDIDFEIRFLPERYTIPALALSVLTMVAAGFYSAKRIWARN